MIRRKKLNIFIIILVVSAFFLTTTYALFIQPVAGNSRTANESWNIGFTNVIKSAVYGSATEITPVNYTRNSSIFNIHLNGSGDKIVYDFTIKNDGMLDAKVESISILPPSGANEPIIFETSGLKVGDVLKSGSSANMQVSASYNSNYQGNSKSEKSITVLVNYAQK